MQVLPSLSSLFDLSFLPKELNFVNTGVTQALQGVFYKNYNVSRGLGLSGATSFDIELVSYKVLRLGLPSTDFALSINEQDLATPSGQATVPVTTIPLSGSYRWGILQYIPTYDITQVPISTALGFITLAEQILDSTPEAQFSAVFEAFVAQPIPATAVSTSRLPQLQGFATTLRTHYGSALALANPLAATTELAAFQEIIAALTAANIRVMAMAQEIYISPPGSNISDSLTALDRYFYAATGLDFRAFILDLLIPEVSIATELAAAVEFPRSVLLPVRWEPSSQKYVVEANTSIKAKLVFAKAQFTFSTKGGFGYDANLTVAFPPNQPRVQLGDTGLQVAFTEAKLDLSTERNIPEADADGRPTDFRGIYVAQAAVFLSDSWSVNTGSIGVTNLLVGTGGLSGKFAVQGTTLLQARLFSDILVNFQSFDVTFSHSEVIVSDIRGNFTLDSFLGPNGQPAPFSFELTYGSNGYRLEFTAPIINGKPVPVTVGLGSFADVHLTKLALGKQGTNWYLDLAADIEVTQALPIIGKALPSNIVISHLLIESDPASVDITARPIWDDGSTITPPSGSLTSDFSFTKALNKSIFDVLKLDKLRLSTHKDSDGTLHTQVTFDANLGLTSDSTAAAGIDDNTPPPGFRAYIANAGFTSALSPTPNGTGNLGLAEVELGIKLPDSAGLSVNAGGLVGAGKLAILDNGARYEGVLALTFRDELHLAAYGILTRNLPNGGEGPSLLAMITAQFGDIQLGMGFTLKAVGGLLGLHRAADTDNLRGLVRAGQLNQLLFPAPATASIASLTATLAIIDAAFPATEGRYVIGLMAKLGWGAPATLITLDAALLIELPSPIKLVIMGILEAIFPNKAEDKQILKLRADFLGFVDFGSKRISFDASLSDSHILSFTLTGSMAFRLYQGNDPLFVITAGGFHPSFQPPAAASLTGLKRLTLSFTPDDDLRITLASYFAVTSNTVQFGSRLDLYYYIGWGYHIDGHFGFDVLFQFNPFRVLAHMDAYVAIKDGDSVVLGVYLSLDVTGPGPWHIWGSATISVFGFDISVDVSASIGNTAPASSLPAPDVHALVLTALSAPDSWETEAPAAGLSGVVLQSAKSQTGQLFLDPRGALVLRQNVVPLGLLIEKYGSGTTPPINGNQFELRAINVGTGNSYLASRGELEAVRDFFAPDQYRRLSDREKLSSPSFQLLPCGVRVKSFAGLVGATTATRRVVEYETLLVDATATAGGTTGGATVNKLSPTAFQQLARNSALGKAYQAAQPSARAPHPVGWSEDGYAVVNAADLSRCYQDRDDFGSQIEAEQYRLAFINDHPTLAGEVLVVPLYQLELA